MRISDWSSDVCSSDLPNRGGRLRPGMFATVSFGGNTQPGLLVPSEALIRTGKRTLVMLAFDKGRYRPAEVQPGRESGGNTRSEEQTSELQSLMRSSYAVFCLKKQ